MRAVIPVAIHVAENRSRLVAPSWRIDPIGRLILRTQALALWPATKRADHRVLVNLEGNHLVLLNLRPLRPLARPAKKPPMRNP